MRNNRYSLPPLPAGPDTDGEAPLPIAWFPVYSRSAAWPSGRPPGLPPSVPGFKTEHWHTFPVHYRYQLHVIYTVHAS